MYVPLEQMPDSYGQYFDRLHHRGANVNAILAMLIVTEDAEKVKWVRSGYAFIERHLRWNTAAFFRERMPSPRIDLDISSPSADHVLRTQGTVKATIIFAGAESPCCLWDVVGCGTGVPQPGRRCEQ